MKSSKTLTIDLGILGERECNVYYSYSKYYPATWNEPEEKEEFEITSLLCDGVELEALLDEETHEAVHKIIVDTIASEYEP